MPRVTFSNPFGGQDPERTQLVQAYMVLHSQQTSIRRRLSSSSSSVSSISSSSESSRPSSPDFSPARIAVYHDSPTGLSPPEPSSPSSQMADSSFFAQESSSFRTSRPSGEKRTSLPSVPSIPEDPDEEDEGKLFDVNGKIKTTLTDLMNCESVKHDSRMRSWVQTRLMDTQQNMNSEKRRRVTLGTRPHADPVVLDRSRKLSL